MKKQVIISNGIKPTDNGYDRVYEVWKNGSADRVFDTYKEARDYVEKESKSGSTYAEGGGIDSIKYRGTIELEKGDKIRIDHPHIKGLTLLIIGRLMI
jgi:hypothetical protein